MNCVNVREPSDDHASTWEDNDARLPLDAPYELAWSNAGPRRLVVRRLERDLRPGHLGRQLPLFVGRLELGLAAGPRGPRMDRLGSETTRSDAG